MHTLDINAVSELLYSWVSTIGKVVQQVQHDRGGHFAAHDVPELLVADLRKMFGKGGPAFKVVPGKYGYDVTD